MKVMNKEITDYWLTAELNAEFERLRSLPPRDIRQEALENYLSGYFGERCPRSEEIYRRAANIIPGAVQHNQAFNYPFPIVINKASGAHLEDVDGNRYIDFLQGGGTTLLGTNPQPVREKLGSLMEDCGPVTCLFHEYELKLAEFIVERFPGVEMFRMLGSGTEADMGAIRLARVATGKKSIIKLGAGFHGWSDQLSFAQRIPGIGSFECHGIPKEIFRHIQEAYPGDLGSLKRVLVRNRLRGGTAAVILEPMGPESGTRPLPPDYAAGVRALCDEFGSLLIFDEVVTGFRMGMSGAQGLLGVVPDLTSFGKIVAGGYPAAGGLGGKREYMQRLAGGLGGKKGKKAHVGGTLAANPLSCAAGFHTLSELERINGPEKAAVMGERLTAGLRKLTEKYGLPYVAYNQGSMVHLETTGPILFDLDKKRFWKIPAMIKELYRRKDIMVRLGAAFTAEGLVTVGGSRMFTNAAFTEEIIDDALERFERVFKNIEGVQAGSQGLNS